MSKKCWVFGDSFQDSTFPRGQKQSWVDIVFSEKGYEVKNYATAGISTEAIVTMCRDCIDEIQPDDFVLVCLSTGPRFMSPTKRGNKGKKFTRYIDTDLNHPSVWADYEENNRDQRILDYADRFNSPLGDRLKHSTWNNYISLVLRDTGANFKILHGHFEPIEVKSDYVTEYMHDYSLRTFIPEVTNYYDLTDAMKLPTGHCLINDFFHVQIKYLMDTYGDDAETALKNINVRLKLKLKAGDYRDSIRKYFLSPIENKFGKESCIFFDSWHLNPTGQRIYAGYAKDYEWRL
jgi:hypothetical protein